MQGTKIKSVPVTLKKKNYRGNVVNKKPNALDEFWASLGDYHKCKTLTPKT